VLKKFSDFIKEWTFEPGKDTGHKVGARVRVHLPGHADHGKEGELIRHQGTDSLVNFGPGKGASFHNRGDLKVL
jgi:hypothetical protein